MREETWARTQVKMAGSRWFFASSMSALDVDGEGDSIAFFWNVGWNTHDCE
jgi:hypothetical protein